MIDTPFNFQDTSKQTAAFQKIWMESINKTMQAAFTITPGSPPPEMILHMRKGIFAALAESWEEFMRTPQFLEGMQRLMEQTVSFRKMSNDLMAKMRNELQSPSREDIDNIMVTVRHIEKRLLDRVDELSSQVSASGEATATQIKKSASMAAPRAATARRSAPAKRSPKRKTSRKK